MTLKTAFYAALATVIAITCSVGISAKAKLQGNWDSGTQIYSNPSIPLYWDLHTPTDSGSWSLASDDEWPSDACIFMAHDPDTVVSVAVNVSKSNKLKGHSIWEIEDLFAVGLKLGLKGLEKQSPDFIFNDEIINRRCYFMGRPALQSQISFEVPIEPEDVSLEEDTVPETMTYTALMYSFVSDEGNTVTVKVTYPFLWSVYGGDAELLLRCILPTPPPTSEPKPVVDGVNN